MEDNGWETEDVSLGASVSVPPAGKSSKLHGWPSIVLSYSLGDQLLYIEVQFMFTPVSMRYRCVSLIHQTMTQTTGSLMC